MGCIFTINANFKFAFSQLFTRIMQSNIILIFINKIHITTKATL